MKSNCEKASMKTPSRVDIAPWVTGANMCSSARTVRRLRSPMLPTKLCTKKCQKMLVQCKKKLTIKMWMVNSTPRPTDRMRMTAGTALSLIPSKPRAPNN